MANKKNRQQDSSSTERELPTLPALGYRPYHIPRKLLKRFAQGKPGSRVWRNILREDALRRFHH